VTAHPASASTQRTSPLVAVLGNGILMPFEPVVSASLATVFRHQAAAALTLGLDEGIVARSAGGL
jgi:hypothetical protein